MSPQTHSQTAAAGSPVASTNSFAALAAPPSPMAGSRQYPVACVMPRVDSSSSGSEMDIAPQATLTPAKPLLPLFKQVKKWKACKSEQRRRKDDPVLLFVPPPLPPPKVTVDTSSEDLSVFDLLNILQRQWFLCRDHLADHVLSAQMNSEGRLFWVKFAPSSLHLLGVGCLARPALSLHPSARGEGQEGAVRFHSGNPRRLLQALGILRSQEECGRREGCARGEEGGEEGPSQGMRGCGSWGLQQPPQPPLFPRLLHPLPSSPLSHPLPFLRYLRPCRLMAPILSPMP